MDASFKKAIISVNFMSTVQLKDKKGSLAFKLSFFILTGAIIVFLAAFIYDYHYSRKIMMKNVENHAKNLTLVTVNKIGSILKGVEKVPGYIAFSLERRVYTREEILKMIENELMTNPELFGSTVAFEPYAFDSEVLYFAPYFYKDEEKLKFRFLDHSYRYFSKDWYRIPKELKRPVWSEPYFDEGGGDIIMSTYSVPFTRIVNGESEFKGVVTADISLDWLLDIVSQVTIYQSGYAFLISQNGVFVTHPDKDLIMQESIFSIAESAGDMRLRKIGEDMISGGEGFVSIKGYLTGKKSWLYYAPLPSVGWSIGIIFPEDELFADVSKLNREVLIIGGAGVVLLFLIVVSISRTITRPLRILAQETTEIARGNLDIELPLVKSRDEVGELSKSFENMRVALKEYIANLEETTAAKERIENELKIAQRIQMSFLPKKFPPFPEKEAFEIYAMIEPAKEVGGDLYDFFLLPEDHIFIAIGDVSDKGIPAALFMAVTKTLMKGIAAYGIEPADVLVKVNRELCKDNDSMMFVTLFCGILNCKTGELTYSNAGHNPPLMIHSDKRSEWLHVPKGLVLGAMEDADYKTEKTVLYPGDTIFLYTDGVTEAMNSTKNMYSDKRLQATVEESNVESAEFLVRHIMQSVKDFTGNEIQSDDITILAVQFKGSGERQEDTYEKKI
jgi:sigma-B regulation protein RsbU (phosphoserine phosphatase)